MYLKIKTIMGNTAVYCQPDTEAIRVSYCEENTFTGIGEESGEEYTFNYADVDLDEDMFYELKLIDKLID